MPFVESWIKYAAPFIERTPVGDKTFYTYTLSYPEGFLEPDGHDLSGIVFYVGKGKWSPRPTPQRIDMHEKEATLACYASSKGVNRYKVDVIRRIWLAGKSVLKRVVFESSDEKEILASEKELIKQHTSPYLMNRNSNSLFKERMRTQIPPTSDQRPWSSDWS